jgi:hypothetical protein
MAKRGGLHKLSTYDVPHKGVQGWLPSNSQPCTLFKGKGKSILNYMAIVKSWNPDAEAGLTEAHKLQT